MKEGYKLVEHRAVFVKFPLQGPARREPARLDDDAVDADEQRRRGGQSGADLPQGEAQGRDLLRRQGRVQAEPHGVERRRGRAEASSEGQEARLARRRAAPQEHRAALQVEGRQGRLRDRRRSEGRGHARLGVRRAVRRPAGAAARRTASRRKWRRSSQSAAGPGESAAASRTASSPGEGRRRETEGTGIVHIAPGCGKDDFQLGKEQRPAAGRPARRRRRLPRRLRPADRQERRRPGDRRRGLRGPEEEGPCCSPPSATSTATRTAGGARRSCSSGWWTSGSSTCEQWPRRDHGGASTRSTFLPESINGQARELRLAREHGRLDDLQEALLGPGAADLGGREDPATSR